METLDNDLKYVANLMFLDKHDKIKSRNLLMKGMNNSLRFSLEIAQFTKLYH